jgi:hypothetical protein
VEETTRDNKKYATYILINRLHYELALIMHADPRLLVPARPILQPQMRLELVDLVVVLSNRTKLEKQLREGVSRTVLQFESPQSVHVSARRLKGVRLLDDCERARIKPVKPSHIVVGVHNTHRVVGSWVNVELDESEYTDELVAIRDRIPVDGMCEMCFAYCQL